MSATRISGKGGLPSVLMAYVGLRYNFFLYGFLFFVAPFFYWSYEGFAYARQLTTELNLRFFQEV
jgi:hypothetical protein